MDSVTLCCLEYTLSLHLWLEKLLYKTIENTLLQRDYKKIIDLVKNWIEIKRL